MSYILKDHQGSMYAAVTGRVTERYGFDAWGRRRNPQTLSPDIVIQDGQNSQAYNRYSYCFNNPLRFTDPSGYVTTIPPEFEAFYYSDILLDPEKYMDKLKGNHISMASYNTELSEGKTVIKYSWRVGDNSYEMSVVDHGLKGEQMCENSCAAFAVAAQEARLNGNPELTEAYYMEKTENACQKGLVYSDLLDEHVSNSSVYVHRSYGNTFPDLTTPANSDFEMRAYGNMYRNRGVSFRFYNNPIEENSTFGHVMNVSNAVEFKLNNAVMGHELNLWDSHFIYDKSGIPCPVDIIRFLILQENFIIKTRWRNLHGKSAVKTLSDLSDGDS